MQFWKRLASGACALTLGACAAGGASAPLRIRDAAVAGGVLTAHVQWQPSQAVLDALDNGIVLDFAIDLRAFGPSHLGWQSTLARTERHIELRYFPLTRRYQMRDLDRGETRSFAARSLLFTALEDLHLDLPPAFSSAGAEDFGLQIELERDRLPGALRLPALLRGDWHLSSRDFRWPAAHAG